jgi:hypothetical protein
MKLLRVLAVGTAFLCGIPVGLCAYGLGPISLFSHFTSLQQIMDIELLVRSCIGVLLWAVWIYGASCVLFQAVTLKRHGSIEPSDKIFAKSAAAFVVTLWLLTSQSTSKSLNQESAVDRSQVEIPTTTQGSRNAYQTLMPSAFAIMALLSMIEGSHRRKLQLSMSGMYDDPVSNGSRLYWSKLRFQASAFSQNRETPQVPESGLCESVVVTIPVGMNGEETVLLSMGRDDQIFLNSTDGRCADEFGLYLNCYLSSSNVRVKTVNYGTSDSSSVCISQTNDGWKIDQSGVVFSPFVMRREEAESFRSLQLDLAKPLVNKTDDYSMSRIGDWQICVRVMGPVEVANRSWETLRFERSKSTELLTWLVMHRERPTRIAARTALWEVSIEDSTFNNVVSGVRRAINQNGQNLLAKESNDVFRIGSEVITDVEILQTAIEKVKLKGGSDDFLALRGALELVRDLPFAGENFVWADTEGITSNVVLTIISGALLLSDFYMAQQDLSGVFWATGQGLKALRGHEALIAMRMKAHAQERNISGINSEWLAYERLRLAEDQFLDRECNEIAKLRDSLLTTI